MYKLTDVEGISAVPALGSKLPALSDDSVEVTEREQNDLELCFLGTHLQCVLVEVVKSLVEVC